MPSQQRGHYSSTVGRTDATKAMAPDQLAMALGMGLGMGKMPMGMTGMEAAPASFSSAYLCGLPNGDAMRVDDLLDFSNKDGLLEAATGVSVPETHQHGHGHLPMHDPSPASGSLDCSGYNLMGSFSDDFYMPSEEAAELEWLSKFVDDSFSDVPFSSSSSSSFGGSTDSGEGAAPSSKYTALRAEHSSAIPGRARSKRSRAPTTALHHNPSTSWSSPSPQSPPFRASPTSPSPSPSFSGNAPSGPKSAHGSSNKKKEAAGAVAGRPEGGVRRCTHCASEKTPQWRAGPLGPKTLCNACGVRYKSGRLVAEYRPAASPTFLLTQHSNSHRKVMELRRQKELLLLRQQPQGGGFPPAASSPSSASTTRPAEHVAGVIHAPPVPPPLFPP